MRYEVSTDRARLDIDLIHKFLSTESYWAKNIPRDVMERSIENSIPFAAYDDRGGLAGFARVVTDRAVFAYIGDVFVLPEHRGHGVSKMIMQAIRAHPHLQGLRRWHLLTRDAHALYRQFGFQEIENPKRHMEMFDPNVYVMEG
jgi:N-acetylglutamate synthase-like GNAT family acetyltransferase